MIGEHAFLEHADFSVASSFTLSFKMRAPHNMGNVSRYVLNKAYEYVTSNQKEEEVEAE